MDLAYWFFANYTILDINTEMEVDGPQTILFPFMARVAHQIAHYHKTVMEHGHRTVGTPEQVDKQIRSAILHIPEMEQALRNEMTAEVERGYDSDCSDGKSAAPELFDLNFDFMAFMVQSQGIPNDQRPQIYSFLDSGKNLADAVFFIGLGCQFDLSDFGNVFALLMMKICF